MAIEEPTTENEPVIEEKTFHVPSDLHSPYVLVVNMDKDKVLYEKGGNEEIYPASLTKVMTCILGIMKHVDLNEEVDVTYQDVEGLAEQQASIAGFVVGQTITYRDALYGLMLPSGADAGNVLANNVSGGYSAYVSDMNRLAKYIGMEHSQFINTSGLHDDSHYTTLNDLKELMMFAWKFPVFRTVFQSSEYATSFGALLESTRNTYGDTSIDKGSIIGSKTGYTPEAGCCMISIAEIDGTYYMVISAKADGMPPEEHYHLDDARNIYNQIIKDFHSDNTQPVTQDENLIETE